jgi:hypothetical protein
MANHTKSRASSQRLGARSPACAHPRSTMVTWRTVLSSEPDAHERIRAEVRALITAIMDRRITRKQLLALVDELKAGRET